MKVTHTRSYRQDGMTAHAEVADAPLAAVVDLRDADNPFDTTATSCECGEWADQLEGAATPCPHRRAARAVETARAKTPAGEAK